MSCLYSVLQSLSFRAAVKTFNFSPENREKNMYNCTIEFYEYFYASIVESKKNT